MNAPITNPFMSRHPLVTDLTSYQQAYKLLVLAYPHGPHVHHLFKQMHYSLQRGAALPVEEAIYLEFWYLAQDIHNLRASYPLPNTSPQAKKMPLSMIGEVIKVVTLQQQMEDLAFMYRPQPYAYTKTKGA